MEKLQGKIDGLRYQVWRTKHMILDIEPREKKKRGEDFFKLPEHLTQDWIKEHQASLVEEQREKIKKKFEKDNEKRLGEGESKMSAKELESRLEAADELEQKFKTENKLKKVVAEGRGSTVEKLDAQIDKLNERIATSQIQAEDKEGNKEVALGTSKIVSPSFANTFAC